MVQLILDTIVQSDVLHRDVEREIVNYFDESIFAPLRMILENAGIPLAKRQNASISAVSHALTNRTIWYADGVFTGRFSSAISRELRDMGATHDKRLRIFRLPSSRLPMDLRLTIQQSDAAARDATNKILASLDQMQANIAKANTGVRLEGPVNRMLEDLQGQFAGTLKRKGLDVPPDLTEQTRKDIADQYTFNLDLFIKNFAEQRIPVLRQKVQEIVFEGCRTDKLAKVLQAEFGVSRRKAAFLAEQETSILVAKYRESRYKRIGSRRYIWVTGKDGRVRPDHAALHGKEFFWDQPPITNRATGARNNPGEEFGCRCRARPVLIIQE